MKLNKEKVQELMNKYGDGNYNKFGKELGVDPAHLHRFIKTGVGGGKKVIFSIMKFCKERGIDFTYYIEM